MKITVSRERKDSDLTFTIKVTQIDQIQFTEVDQMALKMLNKLQTAIPDDASKIANNIKASIKNFQHVIYERLKANLEQSIKADLMRMIRPMCQEIYNAQYDLQTGELKQWMESFDLQRTKYYFDGDKRCNDGSVEEFIEEDEES